MGEERLYILKMLEEGKITAQEAEALLQALEGDEPGDEDRGAPAARGAEEGAKGDSRDDSKDDGQEEAEDGEGPRAQQGDSNAREESGWISRDLADQIRDSIQSALKNVPHVRDELKENWQDVREEIRHSLREIQEEMRKGPLIDMRGLSELFANLRTGVRGPAHEFEERVSSEFGQETEHPIIRLETKNGSISVTGWDRPMYDAIIRKRVHGRDEAEAAQAARDAAQVHTDSGTLEIRAKDGQDVAVSIELKVPKERVYDLEATSKNGSVSLEKVFVTNGRVRTTNGGVKLRDVRGERLEAGTVNGKITCEDVFAGDVKVRTNNGGIVWDGAARSASVETTNGGLRLNARVPKGSPADPGDAAGQREIGHSKYSARTVNGSIRVQVPPAGQAGVRFDAKGRAVDVGDESGDFSLEHHKRHGYPRHVSGASSEYEQAKNRLELELGTVNGSVSITREESGREKRDSDEG